MPQSKSLNQLNFAAPGPGSWSQDGVHFPRPLTHYYQAIQPEPFKQGAKDFAQFYGLLNNGIEMCYVNGFGYSATVPLPVSDISERIVRAEQVFEQKLWREQIRYWEEHCKPQSIAMHMELQSIDPDSLNDAELSDYLKRCAVHHAAMIKQHIGLTVGAIIATGDYLAHAGRWTNLSNAELLDLFRGAATVSSGSSKELVNLKTAFSKDPIATAILNSNKAPRIIVDELLALQSDAGDAMRAYIDLIGNRLLDGFDIAEPTAIELPDALLRSIRSALYDKKESGLTVEALTYAVREKVPPEHQSFFDELLQEARSTYYLRDERGIYSDIWAAGIMRRAALAAGRRLNARGIIAKPLDIIEANVDEMSALILGSGGPDANELTQRALYRTSHTSKDAPVHLGDAEAPLPDLSTLPPLAARVMEAVGLSLSEIFRSSSTEHDEHEMILMGLAASKGIYEGKARRVSSPTEFDQIVKGDILVTESTTEAFNILLPLLGGIVTDNGGLLSHAAIVAREYGIPGVVGTRSATSVIKNGDRLRVDGDNGKVEVLK